MVTEQAVQRDVEWLRQRMSFRDEPEVSRYLRLHPEVVAVLTEALDRLPSFFASDTPMVLDPSVDPEEEDDVTTLIALFQTPLDPVQAMPLLDRFNQSWWLEASRGVDGGFTFGLEYVRTDEAMSL